MKVKWKLNEPNSKATCYFSDFWKRIEPMNAFLLFEIRSVYRKREDISAFFGEV